VITLRPERTAAIIQTLNNGTEVQLHHIQRAPGNRKKSLPCVALLLKRGNERVLLPDDKTALKPYDRILFAGNLSAKSSISDICNSAEILHYMLTGDNLPRSQIGKWLARTGA
jgi:hypothetical protein